jgi:TetR/AcrR family transcriptional regulator, copper-responsive repressor
MARGKKHTPEQIVSLLRQIEVAVGNNKTMPVACRDNGISFFSGLCIERNLKSVRVSSTRKIESFMTALRSL